SRRQFYCSLCTVPSLGEHNAWAEFLQQHFLIVDGAAGRYRLARAAAVTRADLSLAAPAVDHLSSEQYVGRPTWLRQHRARSVRRLEPGVQRHATDALRVPARLLAHARAAAGDAAARSLRRALQRATIHVFGSAAPAVVLELDGVADLQPQRARSRLEEN